MSCCPIVCAAVCTSFRSASVVGVPGSRARQLLSPWARAGAAASSRFAPNTPPKKLTPVTLPPGRLRLATRPFLTGSPPLPNTIGIVVVAALAPEPHCCRRRSRPLASQSIQRPERVTDRYDRPPTGIRSRRSGRRRSPLPSGPGETRRPVCATSASGALRRNPTTGIAGCCARAASGQPAVAPPSSVINSRRFMLPLPGASGMSHLAQIIALRQGVGITAPSSNSALRSLPHPRPRRGCRPP